MPSEKQVFCQRSSVDVLVDDLIKVLLTSREFLYQYTSSTQTASIVKFG